MLTMKKLTVFLIRCSLQTTAIITEFPSKETISRRQYGMIRDNLIASKSCTKHSPLMTLWFTRVWLDVSFASDIIGEFQEYASTGWKRVGSRTARGCQFQPAFATIG